MMSNSAIVSDPEMQDTLKSSGGGIAASVEVMKTRKAAQAMMKALRDVNPKLAKALIDDRDKVFLLGRVPFCDMMMQIQQPVFNSVQCVP